MGTEVEIAIVERYDLNTMSIDPPANDPLAPQTCGTRLAFEAGDMGRVRVDRINERGPEFCRRTRGSVVSLQLQGNNLPLDPPDPTDGRGLGDGVLSATAGALIGENCSGTVLLSLSAPGQPPVVDRIFFPASGTEASCGIELLPGLESCVDRYVFEYTEYPEK